MNFKPIVAVQRSIQKKSVLDVITDIGGSMGPELHIIVDIKGIKLKDGMRICKKRKYYHRILFGSEI